ncbi:hypothetical protein [Chloroflexus sp.]|uniref:hypothetical protein n=1 Tax=Chloroflexus sp. TaxID=1904827 RepID=UPI002620B4A0|nr:hypothetical protein [uncultured Chloroflexus sp.]
MRQKLGEEWRRIIRRRRALGFLVGAMLVMLLAVQGIAGLANPGNLTASPLLDTPLLGAQLGRLFVAGFCLVLQGWLILATPLLAMSAYVDDPLAASIPPDTLLARLLAVWGLLLVTGAVTLPFFSILPLFGSLDLSEVGWALTVILVTGLLNGAYGVCWMALLRSPPAALFLAYSVLLLWLVVAVLIAASSLPPAVVVVAVAFNPFAALLSPIAPAFPPTGPIATDLRNLLQLTHGGLDPATPLHHLYIAGCGLLILLFFAVASVAARPKPRRWQRFDTLLVGLGLLYLIGLWFWREWWLAPLL